MLRVMMIALAMALLGGCATAIKGSTQDVRIGVNGPQQADCRASNSYGQWNVRAPGTIKVERGSGSLNVTCEEPGYKPASQVATSTFNGATVGNILLGGVIGVAIDAASGAMYSYPDQIQLTLEPDCAADDAECAAKLVAEQERRLAEQAAQAAAAAKETAALADPAAPANEKQRALEAAQGQFDAWYAGNKAVLQQKLSQVVRDENLLRTCAAHTRPAHPVDIVDTTVIGQQSDGYLLNVSYIKVGDHSTCDESRTDAFLVRIQNDKLEEVTYHGPGGTS